MPRGLLRLKKYRIEIFLIVASFGVAVFSFLTYLKTQDSAPTESVRTVVKNTRKKDPTIIYIDLSGSVEKPDVFGVTPGARLKDVLALAGGLSSNADHSFFARNFNLSRFVQDQEKIYIPASWEINTGIFVENPRIVDETVATQLDRSGFDNTININTATSEELETLPGIGKTTAEKIINGRPYQAIDELVAKKIVNKTTYERIKDFIGL